jgi:hypothetical protein
MERNKILALSFAISYFQYKKGEITKEQYIQIWRKANEELTEEERKRAIRFVTEMMKSETLKR